MLTPFERLLLLRCLRVDRVTVGVTRWVIGELGERYVTPPVRGIFCRLGFTKAVDNRDG